MARYVMIRMTRSQAQAASNACDLIADAFRVAGDKREASLYERVCEALDQIRAPHKQSGRKRR